MKILYCGDDNIRDGLLISILSLIKHVKEELNIYVLTVNVKIKEKEIKGVKQDIIEYIDKIIKQINPNSYIKLIDITNLFNKSIPEKNIETRFTPCCMLRLYSDMIEEISGKILYLDNDVMIRKDITELYNMDIRDYEIAGVLDYYGKWFFKNKHIKFNYINSGVLLLNMDVIRRTRTV